MHKNIFKCNYFENYFIRKRHKKGCILTYNNAKEKGQLKLFVVKNIT